MRVPASSNCDRGGEADKINFNRRNDVKSKIDGACLVVWLVGCTGLVCGKPEEGLSVSGKGE